MLYPAIFFEIRIHLARRGFVLAFQNFEWYTSLSQDITVETDSYDTGSFAKCREVYLPLFLVYSDIAIRNT